MAETLEKQGFDTLETLSFAMEGDDIRTMETHVVDGEKKGFEMDETLVLENVEEEKKVSSRAEIDTSMPFESVKEAVSRFGGSGVWRPQQKNLVTERVVGDADPCNVEEEAAQLEKDLIMKERETLEVLKELQNTKRVVDELKLKLQKEASENIATQESNVDNSVIRRVVMETEIQNPVNLAETNQDFVGGFSLCPSSSPGLILMELKQAKVNLTRTTSDLAGIRSSVDSLNKKIEKERLSLKKTQERLSLNSAKISSLEEELNQTRMKLQLAKEGEIKGNSENPQDFSKELQQLSAEADQFKTLAEAAKSEVLRAMAEIEQTKTSMRTAEIRWVAAMKMVEAARATEASALAEIKALLSSQSSSGDLLQQHDGVTLSFEEYSSLTRKVQEAEELSKKRVLDAMLHIDEANMSKMEILKKVEEAADEVETSKKVLEEALNRVETANRGKLAVEESLRKWRADHGQQKRRSVHNSTKFKNSYPSHQRRDSRHIDVNELNLVNDGSKPGLKQTLSIGQILSKKLLLPEEFDMEMQKENVIEKPKVSLGQMLGKQTAVLSPPWDYSEKEGSAHKQFSAKRKKFGFARFSLLLAKESKKKKKQAPR